MYDRHAIQQQPQAAILAAAMQWAPRMPWRVAAADAVAAWDIYVRTLLRLVCPPARKLRRRKHWLSEQTFQAVTARAAARRRLELCKASSRAPRSPRSLGSGGVPPSP
eukprot:2127720-Lingulodinium_polyedra.AAC.1